MIPRYESKEISRIWSDDFKFKKFLEVELSLLESLEELKIIPANTSLAFKDVKIKPERILELEEITRHDVIAFCTSITEQIKDDNISKYFHFGVTSSDIIDTALSLQVKESLTIILTSYEELLKELKSFCLKHKNLMAIGRSHGIFAEPLSFGQKFLSFYSEFQRHYQDLKAFYQNDLTCQASGAVGNYVIIPPAVEMLMAKKLGLKVEPVSTQIIPRDHLTKMIQINSRIACAIERICIEIRHLHHSDVAEVSEGFAKGQKGSSTMPHKKNPISTENLSGLARFLRSHVAISEQNCLLWHERDISHSSAERLYLPDNLGILHYSLKRLKSTIANLEVNETQVENKPFQNIQFLSSYILHQLIVKTHLSREKLYPIVQAACFQAQTHQDLGLLKQQVETEVNKLETNIQLEMMDRENIKSTYLKHIDETFKRFDI